jgi:hypothetical protein
MREGDIGTVTKGKNKGGAPGIYAKAKTRGGASTADARMCLGPGGSRDLFVSKKSRTTLAARGGMRRAARGVLVGRKAGQRNSEELLLGEEGIEVGQHFGASPVLGADDFAFEKALAIDDVALRVHGGAVGTGDSVVGIEVGRKIDIVRLQEILIGGLVFAFAGIDTENGATARSDASLELIEGGSFLDAWWTPGGPKIQDDDFAAQVGKVSGLAVEGENKVPGRLAAHAGFALAVIGMNEKGDEDDDEDENGGGFQFAYQSSTQTPYNRIIE